jgi:adenosine 3'-phospho 5'-phosphosulfate transporter B2
MMFAVNMWSLAMTFITLVASSELFVSLKFLSDNPAAITDQMIISATSATGQLFIYFTIRRFGPITFTIIMTTRQIFSMVLSAFAFGHTIPALGGVGALMVFAVVFVRARRGGGD